MWPAPNDLISHTWPTSERWHSRLKRIVAANPRWGSAVSLPPGACRQTPLGCALRRRRAPPSCRGHACAQAASSGMRRAPSPSAVRHTATRSAQMDGNRGSASGDSQQDRGPWGCQQQQNGRQRRTSRRRQDERRCGKECTCTFSALGFMSPPAHPRMLPMRYQGRNAGWRNARAATVGDHAAHDPESADRDASQA